MTIIPAHDSERGWRLLLFVLTGLTALIYLNNDYEGGETAFVRTALKVRGRKGDALIFRNILEDRSVNPLSEHAGLPVIKGAKFLASRWIRERRWVA